VPHTYNDLSGPSVEQCISNTDLTTKARRFSNALQRRASIGRWVKMSKADIEYPLEHVDVINYTLDGVPILSCW
jgi:hypothetical protein